MVDFAVYYRVNPTFRPVKNLTKAMVLAPWKNETDATEIPRYVKVCTAQDPGRLDEIFAWMQAENMPDIVKAVCKNAKLHTSMSVGDVVQNLETDEMFQCMNDGWEAVPA